MLRSSWMFRLALVIFVFVTPALQAQDDKIIREPAPDQLEKLLKSLKIEFNKTSAPPKKGTEHFYEFTRNNFRIRLTYFSPQELMLDCVFPGLPIEKINLWNTTTKLSRASLQKDNGSDFSLLEYGLDTTGGTSEGVLKQFIVRFDDELKKFNQYLSTNLVDEKLLSTVTDDKIENVFKSIGLTYQKKANSTGVMMFDFEVHNHKLRLYNFGGKDLMMDVHFRKIPLEDVNRYNLSRKFIRVVNYKAKQAEYTALEINFDCETSVTEGMIRHWIISFGEDAKHFGEYAKKVQGSEKK